MNIEVRPCCSRLAAAGVTEFWNPSHIVQYLPEDTRGSEGEEENENRRNVASKILCVVKRARPLTSVGSLLAR
ncbi:hypothetical protein GJAV_G00131940 [Gymnothorax javanicus]|nr:hypothetical protein GJAV_G00131940 [Gymnothorax javanicus]